MQVEDKKMTKFKLYLVAVLLALPLFSTGCRDPLSDVLTGKIVEKTVGSVLDDVEATIDNSVASAQKGGEQYTDFLANEAAILLSNIRGMLKDSEDKLVRNIDKNRRTALAELLRFRKQVADSSRQLNTIEDNFALDIDKVVNKIPFVNDRVVVRGVAGVTHVFSDNEEHYYSVRITATGIGETSNESETLVKSVRLNGNDVLNKSLVQPIGANQIELRLPAQEVNGLFLSKKVANVRTEVELAYAKKGKEKDRLSHKFWLFLHPKVAGTVKIAVTGPEFEWVENGVFSFTQLGKNNHCNGDCDKDDKGDWPIAYDPPKDWYRRDVPGYRAPPNKEGDIKLIDAKIRLDEGQSPNHDWSVTAQIENGGKTLAGGWKPRTRKNNYIISATQMRYSVKNPNTQFDEKEFQFEYGKIYDYQTKIESNSPKVSARFFAGTKLEEVMNAETTLGSRLEVIEIKESGDFVT